MFVLQDAQALLAYEVGKVLIENAALRMENAKLQGQVQQLSEEVKALSPETAPDKE